MAYDDQYGHQTDTESTRRQARTPPGQRKDITDEDGAPEHPHESIMEDADMGSVSYLFETRYSDPKAERAEEEYGHHVNRNVVDDPKSVDAVEEITGEEDDVLEPDEDVMTDGGRDYVEERDYSGESAEEVTGRDVEYIIGM